MESSALVFPDYGGDLRVRIMRRDDVTQQWLSHGYELNRGFTRETVLDRFGGGRYFCQIVSPDSQILKGAKFALPGPYRPDGTVGTTTRPGPAPAAPAPEAAEPARAPHAAASPMDLIERVMASRFLETISGASKPAPSPWAPVLTAMAPALVAALPELLKALRGPAVRTDPTLAAELASLRTMLEQQQRNAGGVASPASLDTFKQFLELQELLRGDDRDSRSGGSVIERFAEIAAAMLQRTAPAAAPTMPTAHAEGVAVATIHNTSHLPMHEQFLLKHGADLGRAAAHNVEPQAVAALVMAELPQSEHGILSALVGREDAAAEIVRVLPNLAPFADWVGYVVHEFRERFGISDDDGGEG